MLHRVGFRERSAGCAGCFGAAPRGRHAPAAPIVRRPLVPDSWPAQVRAGAELRISGVPADGAAAEPKLRTWTPLAGLGGVRLARWAVQVLRVAGHRTSLLIMIIGLGSETGSCAAAGPETLIKEPRGGWDGEGVGCG
ncbi:hypothetical protein GCM10009608_71840 [Pseudonocardia alaniniphila]